MENVVGIDLGTTYSAVAVFDKKLGVVRILENDLGRSCTPSVICIENGNVIIGEAAKQEQLAGNLNVASFYKSYMGDEGYKLYLDGKDYSPEQLSALYLKALKEMMEEKHGINIRKAVITVPAYFNEFSRAATKRAGEAAGMEILEIINEPTSAIMAYGLTGGKKKTVMVYDLGGGTFDVTIASLNGSKVDVMVTNGNHQLGGKIWDNALREEISRRFFNDYSIYISDYPEVYGELLVTCEEVKKKLTNLTSTRVTVRCCGKTAQYTINREDFDRATSPLLEETMLLVHKCFDEIGGGFGWDSVDEVVLVGGSTRMPQVREAIVAEYGKPPVTKNIDVDTIVAAGAAMKAQLVIDGVLQLGLGFVDDNAPSIPGESRREGRLVLRDDDISDITSHSLGMLAVEKDGDNYVNSIIIPKNSKIGKTFGRQYTFTGDDLNVYVLQGESNDPFSCELLYKYVIPGMSERKGDKFTVNYLYNHNGMVEVEAGVDGDRTLAAHQMPITESLEKIIEDLNREREEAKNAVKELEVVFMIDTSGSMSGDPVINARQAIKSFISELDLRRTYVGIVEFATKSRWACDFTRNSRLLSQAVDSLEAGGVCGSGTSETPISKHGGKYRSRKSEKILVVLTDGQWTNQSTEIAAADKLKKSGVRIYAVGFGSADESFLNKIASEKGARKIDLGSLNDAFREIAISIATEA